MLMSFSFINNSSLGLVRLQHNLRLVLFVVNKYFQDFANGSRFQDLCQAGVKGLVTAIDRFEPKRKFRLSTYGLFWIRHAVIRFMTTSSFTKVPFGLESVCFLSSICRCSFISLFTHQRTNFFVLSLSGSQAIASFGEKKKNIISINEAVSLGI